MSCYEAPSEYAASEVLVVSLRRVFACTMYLVVYSGICAIVETFRFNKALQNSLGITNCDRLFLHSPPVITK